MATRCSPTSTEMSSSRLAAGRLLGLLFALGDGSCRLRATLLPSAPTATSAAAPLLRGPGRSARLGLRSRDFGFGWISRFGCFCDRNVVRCGLLGLFAEAKPASWQGFPLGRS